MDDVTNDPLGQDELDLGDLPDPVPELVYLSDLNLTDEWERYKPEAEPRSNNQAGVMGCTCVSCTAARRRPNPTRYGFIDWLRPRLEDPEAADEITWCEVCDVPGLDMNWGDDQYICDPCFEDFCECVHCNAYFSETTTTLNDDEVCEGCRENYYYYCDDCEGWYHGDDGCGGDHDDDEEDNCGCESPAQRFFIHNDGDPNLANDQRATVGLGAGSISDEGVGYICSYLRSFAYDYDLTDEERNGLYGLSYDLPELGDKWQTKQGNYTKRLSSLAYKKHGIKIKPEVLSRVGVIAREHSMAHEYEVEVTRNLNLSAYDFCNSDSCWWQSYSYSRCTLKANGGFGLRSFDGDRVTGRAWVMPLKEVAGSLTPTFETLDPAAFIVFNGYGEFTGYTPARVLAHMAGWTYRKVGFHCSNMYVNSESGYLVAPEEIASRYTDGRLALEVEQHSTLHYTEMETQHVHVA